MPIPFPSRQTDTARRPIGGASSPPGDWRCRCCGKRLGLCFADHVHLRFARGHEYLVGYPVTATCRGCNTLNRRDGDPGPAAA
ncbi:MAG: hypothetical protein KDA73_19185 [Rhodobacteraceae bacterium]|nr:hypothetical protein [Paracoccaceae bacterium]